MKKKRYLKIFNNQNDYESQKDSIMGIPHVVLFEDTKGLVFVPKTKEVDYSTQYFTLHMLSDGNMSLYTPSSYTSGSLAYSVNGGEWTTFNSNTTLTLVTDDEVKVKGIANAYTTRSANTMFSGSCDYEVYGNAMSLLYGDDFEGQTTLTEIYSFQELFYNQKTLKNAENLILPATTLSKGCYFNMFNGCTSLTSAPQLPATTLADYCYSFMFSYCTSLTTAPELPATTLEYGCYSYMFLNCTSLTTAPELPATTLANNCYEGMFYECKSLTESPQLLAARLTSFCYFSMFMGCSKLNKITMLATDISATKCLDEWLGVVANEGTFVTSGIEIPSGSNGIPTGWTVQVVTPSISNTLSTPIDFNYNEGMFTPTVTVELTKIMSEENILSLQPMCDITVNVINKDNSLHTSDYLWVNTKTLSDVVQELNISNINDVAIVIVDADIPEDSGYYYYDVEETEPFVEKDWMRIVSLEDDNEISVNTNIQYSINGADWKKMNYNIITVNTNDIVYFKGTELEPKFSVSKSFNAEGNIMSLIYNNDFEGQTTLTAAYSFQLLFYDQKTLKNAENLILPATTLAEGCYSNMFNGCKSLTTAPELPATTLADSCYQGMFGNCSSLTEAPELPATTLAKYCYLSMFIGCISLTTAPELPATTLAYGCYSYMFGNCSSLTEAPQLPATTLAYGCYSNMFQGCISLTTAPQLLATTLADSCYSNMFYGCSSLTSAPQLPSTTLASDCYWYMFGNCSSLTEAPELPATTLAEGCYSDMFNGCKSLTTAPELPATTLADSCYSNMFYGCSSLTSAPELLATTLASYCYSNMFRDCSSLISAPELPATKLAEGCYWYMFNGCSKLNKITMLATNINVDNCLYNWVDGVASSGTFVKDVAMTSLPSGMNGIPTGWTVENYSA